MNLVLRGAQEKYQDIYYTYKMGYYDFDDQKLIITVV